ncbi:hypothetical protein GCM10007242_15320 [Pigmentiphaga litoralis]|jgi:hypothetical protein|uniref:hypothetical protein n=1 Tax=Pigmentiphaga litoralis TaxID=516702 RepID=UPI001676D576|nr:hypothetical protein [Pigmentiphaga litoralis]GGX10240.1 hypothetical protein GCM10007242_15320 [Pigmentiphaga litoralis]
MTIKINDELRAYIDPLTPDEYDSLERSLLAEGCRDALVLWGDLLVDGHNRYAICTKHNLPFQTIQNERFTSIDDVHLWMIDNHLGRRSVSDFQRGILALRKKDIVLARARALEEAAAAAQASSDAAADAETSSPPPVLATRESIAKAARVSSATIGQIEKIQREAAPELVQAVKAGNISINAAAAVATLPVDAQQAAVAGGRKELREAARLVREQKAAARPPKAPKEEGAEGDAKAAGPATDSEHARLLEKIATLEEENAKLRRQVVGLTTALETARREAGGG